MDTRKPILFDLAQSSGVSLTVEDLSDVNHPVNIKGQSGKRKGMAAMIKGRIYMAQGSEPQSPWVCLNDKTSKPNILFTKEGRNHTEVLNGKYTDVMCSNLDPMFPSQGGYLKPESGKVGFILNEKGVYKVEISLSLEGDMATAGSTLEFRVLRKRDSHSITGAWCSTQLVLMEDIISHSTHATSSALLTGYVDAEEGDDFIVQAHSATTVTIHVHSAMIMAQKLY